MLLFCLFFVVVVAVVVVVVFVCLYFFCFGSIMDNLKFWPIIIKTIIRNENWYFGNAIFETEKNFHFLLDCVV